MLKSSSFLRAGLSRNAGTVYSRFEAGLGYPEGFGEKLLQHPGRHFHQIKMRQPIGRKFSNRAVIQKKLGDQRDGQSKTLATVPLSCIETLEKAAKNGKIVALIRKKKKLIKVNSKHIPVLLATIFLNVKLIF